MPTKKTDEKPKAEKKTVTMRALQPHTYADAAYEPDATYEAAEADVETLEALKFATRAEK
jgi:hypothetical protein